MVTIENRAAKQQSLYRTVLHRLYVTKGDGRKKADVLSVPIKAVQTKMLYNSFATVEKSFSVVYARLIWLDKLPLIYIKGLEKSS